MRSLFPVFIIARSGSTRLPGKMLVNIQGKTVLEHLIDRVKLASRPDRLVLCTTSVEADDCLGRIAEKCGVASFRGDPEDVPARLLSAALHLGVEFFVSAEGDEVFTDPDYIDQVIECYERTGADYIRISGLPIGSWVRGVRTDAMARVCEMKSSGASDGWGRYFAQSRGFQTLTVPAEPPLPSFDPGLRMTLDYPEDLDFLRAVCDRLYVTGQVFRLKDVLRLLECAPELVAINKHLNEVYWQRCEAQQRAQQGEKLG